MEKKSVENSTLGSLSPSLRLPGPVSQCADDNLAISV